MLFSLGIQDVIFIPLMFILGHLRISYVVNRFKLGSHKNALTSLFYYHMFFGLVYMLYVTFLGGDSSGYWRMALQQVQVLNPSWFDYYGVSTTFILFVVYPFSKVLSLNFISGTLMFSLTSFIGLTFIYVLMAPYGKYMKIKGIQLFPAILYLPSLHFWAVGVGKDSLSFFAIATLVFCAKHISKNLILAAFAFILLYHIRPHMAFIMGGGYLFAVLTGGNLKPSQKALGLFVGIIGLIIIWPKVATFLKIEDLSAGSLQGLAEKQVQYLNRSSVGSAIDLSSYPFPIKVFSYLYRPLFFDAHNAFAFFVSFENLIYLLLSLSLLSRRTIKVFRKAPSYLKMGFVGFLGATMAFSLSLSNLGIALRMKNMTMIYLLMFVCMVTAYTNYYEAKRNKQLSK
jgi:hypothetical protein